MATTTQPVDRFNPELVHFGASAETPTKPGFYPGTLMEHYHRWDAASNSRLSKLHRTPAHLRAYLDEPHEETDALRLGRAIHSAILEPDDFAMRYIMRPEGLDRRTKEGKQEWATLCLKYGESGILKADEYAMCLGIRDTAHRKLCTRGLLVGDGMIELSALWTDTATGVTCKGRWDRYATHTATIVDIKSTTDASRRAFERSVFAYGYHRQSALYLDSARALSVPAEHFAILAVEKAPPYEIAVYRLTEGAIDAGREQLNALLPRYAQCMEHNEWPGYTDAVQDLALPDWAWRQIDDDLELEG